MTDGQAVVRRPYQEHPHRDPMRGLVQGGQHAGGGTAPPPPRDAPAPEAAVTRPRPGEQEAASAGQPPAGNGNAIDL
jgi:hypothetical protein